MPTSPEPTPTSSPEPVGGPLTDRWWWSGGVRIVGGGAIAAYQQPVLEWGGTPLNWLMVAIGVGIAGWGVVRVLQDRTLHRAGLSDAPAADLDGPRGPGDD